MLHRDNLDIYFILKNAVKPSDFWLLLDRLKINVDGLTVEEIFNLLDWQALHKLAIFFNTQTKMPKLDYLLTVNGAIIGVFNNYDELLKTAVTYGFKPIEGNSFRPIIPNSGGIKIYYGWYLNNQILSVKQAADYLNLSVFRIYEHGYRKKYRLYKVGLLHLTDRVSLEVFKAEQKIKV